MSRTSIFIVPRASTAWKGNEAGWITASGWALAGQQLWGEALVGTTDGVFSPQESRLFPRTVGLGSNRRQKSIVSGLRKIVPEFFITAYKDWQLRKSKPQIWPIEEDDRLTSRQAMIVWQRHDLFPGPGRRIADKLGVPLITSVEAPVVWEARKWGVARPLWGKWLEKNIEAVSLQASDLVSCVSDEVRDKVISMGVNKSKVIVSPNRVDTSIFHPNLVDDEISLEFNLKGKRVLGWTGSFRAFHGLDTLIDAFKQVHFKHPDTVLMLVGDGLELENIKKRAIEAGVGHSVIFPGKQPFTKIPSYLATFYISLVSAKTAEGFHYSPLKLREYLASGKAVIAPRAGNLSNLFRDQQDVCFYEAGNVADLVSIISRLLEDRQLHETLCNNAVKYFHNEATWKHELVKVCERLGVSY